MFPLFAAPLFAPLFFFCSVVFILLPCFYFASWFFCHKCCVECMEGVSDEEWHVTTHSDGTTTLIAQRGVGHYEIPTTKLMSSCSPSASLSTGAFDLE